MGFFPENNKFFFIKSFSVIWLLFVIFTFLHLYCNFRAVSAVVMDTINSTRMHLLVENFIKNGEVLTPKDISATEPILTSEFKYIFFMFVFFMGI